MQAPEVETVQAPEVETVQAVEAPVVQAVEAPVVQAVKEEAVIKHRKVRKVHSVHHCTCDFTNSGQNQLKFPPWQARPPVHSETTSELSESSLSELPNSPPPERCSNPHEEV